MPLPWHSRRAFLKAGAALILTIPPVSLPRIAAAQNREQMFLVDGWVLTASDLEVLKSHDH